MNIHFMSITQAKSDILNPKLVLFADWFHDMGFIQDALVQFLPEEHGVFFTLCNENIPSYSELYQRSQALGGTLMHCKKYSHSHKLCLITSGASFRRSGLVYGDNLLARYEYGRIHARKLPVGNVQILTPKFTGKWLDDFGFTPGAVMTAEAGPRLITGTLHENGVARTAELVKFARINKLALIQAQRVNDHQHIYSRIEIPPRPLALAGFAPDEFLLATFEYGRFTLQHIDFDALGFKQFQNPGLS